MDYIDEFADGFAHETAHEVEKIEEFFGRGAERVIICAAVDNIFGFEFVAVLFAELFEHCRACRKRITEPVHVLFLALLVKNQRELIKESRKTHDVRFGMSGAPLARESFDISGGLGVRGIVHALPRASPAVGKVVVNLNGVPDYARHKIHGVLVHKFGIYDGNRSVFGVGGKFDLFSSRAVDNLPVFKVFPVGRNLIGEITDHRVERERFAGRDRSLAHEERAVNFALVSFRPRVVAANHEIGIINLIREFGHVFRQNGSVTVANRVRAPFGRDDLGAFDETLVGRDSNSAF